MNSIEELEREVSLQVDGMPAEVLMAFLDKLDQDFKQLVVENNYNVGLRLNNYVALKLTWHRVKRLLEYSWSEFSAQQYAEKEYYYNKLIREARRNYYVAKRRVEGQHESECSCRGCRCLKGLTGPSQKPGQRTIGRS